MPPQQEDCHQKIDELFSGKLYLIGIAAIVVAVIMVSWWAGCLWGPHGSPGADRPTHPLPQIFEMILSMVLCCGIRNSSVY